MTRFRLPGRCLPGRGPFAVPCAAAVAVAMLATPAVAKVVPGHAFVEDAAPVRQVTADDLPACFEERVDVTIDGVDPVDVALDPTRRLPLDWAPGDLVPAPVTGRTTDGDVSERIVPDLVAMHEAARAAGAPFEVVSGFRSGRTQAAIYRGWLDEIGHEPTEDVAAGDGAAPSPDELGTPLKVAPPGHSEHQLGTTIDVVDPSHVQLDSAFADTPAGGWIEAHAHEYGFVTSYPRDAAALSCFGWEPWHLRWVGRDRAAAVHDSGLPLRAWLLQHEAADAP